MSQSDEYETIPVILVNRDGSVVQGQAPSPRVLTWRDYGLSVFLLVVAVGMIGKFIYDLFS